MRLLPLLKQHAQALVGAVERVGQDIGTRNAGIESGGDQVAGDLRLRHEALVARDGCFRATRIVVRPVLRQIRPIRNCTNACKNRHCIARPIDPRAAPLQD
jgi:hypothetical protein